MHAARLKITAGAATMAIIFGAVVIVNAVLLTVFRQWEQ